MKSKPYDKSSFVVYTGTQREQELRPALDQEPVETSRAIGFAKNIGSNHNTGPRGKLASIFIFLESEKLLVVSPSTRLWCEKILNCA